MRKLTASYYFELEIHNFFCPLDDSDGMPKQVLGSKKFTIFLGDNETKWKFKSEMDAYGIYFSLKKESSNSDNFSVKLTCMTPQQAKDRKGTSMYCKNLSNSAEHFVNNPRSLSMPFFTFNCYHEFDENFVLKMYLKMELIEGEFPQEFYTTTYGAYSSSKFKDIYYSGDLSDFMIICSDGAKFPLHRFILYVNSPVMKAMLQTQMQESIENELKVSDIDGLVMHKILLFMYTEEIEGIPEHLEGLLYGSEKYQIQKLKSICIGYMLKNIRNENVIEFFLLAELYNAERLKQLCLMYIEINHEDLRKTEEWEKLSADVLELIEQYAKDDKFGVEVIKFEMDDFFLGLLMFNHRNLKTLYFLITFLLYEILN